MPIPQTARIQTVANTRVSPMALTREINRKRVARRAAQNAMSPFSRVQGDKKKNKNKDKNGVPTPITGQSQTNITGDVDIAEAVNGNSGSGGIPDLPNTPVPETQAQANVTSNINKAKEIAQGLTPDLFDPNSAAFAGVDKGQAMQGYNDALAMQKSRLGGYTSPEMTAMRERGMGEINAGYEGSLRDIQGAMNRGGVTGGNTYAAAMDIANKRGNATAGMEQALMADNAKLQDSRLGAYTQGQAAGMESGFGIDKYNTDQKQKQLDGQLGAVGSSYDFLGTEATNLNQNQQFYDAMQFQKELEQMRFKQAQKLK